MRVQAHERWRALRQDARRVPLQHLALLVFAIFVGVRVLTAGSHVVAADPTPVLPAGSPAVDGSPAPASGAEPVATIPGTVPTPVVLQPTSPPTAVPAAPAPPPTGATSVGAGTPSPTAAPTGTAAAPTPTSSPPAAPPPAAATPSPTASPPVNSAPPAAPVAISQIWRPLPVPRVLGALKAPLSALDYDDDSGGSADFAVGPSTQLATVQHATAYIAIPVDGAEAAAEVYTAVRASSEAGPVIVHRVVTAADLIAGAPCEAILAPPGAATSVVDGLADTGQLPVGEVLQLVSDCRAGRVALLAVDFAVPRELPPGRYFTCAGALTAAGYGAASACRPFEVIAVDALATDIAADGIGLGDLRSGVTSSARGDFAVGNAAATIVNTGNTIPAIAVRIQPFTLEATGPAPAVVRGNYGVSIRAPAVAGSAPAVESQAAFLADMAVASREFTRVCLAPGERAALDFEVTPQGALASGSYAGALHVAARAAVAGVANSCALREVPSSMLVEPVKGPFAPGWVASTWVWARDADGDGHGGRSASAFGPAPPPGYVAVADDCDDTRERVYPGAPEIADGLDNDCDGTADLVVRAAPSPTPIVPAAVGAPSPTPTPGAGAPTATPSATAVPPAVPTPAAGPATTPTPTPSASPSPAPTPPPASTPTASPTPGVSPTPMSPPPATPPPAATATSPPG